MKKSRLKQRIRELMHVFRPKEGTTHWTGTVRGEDRMNGELTLGAQGLAALWMTSSQILGMLGAFSPCRGA